MIKALIICIAIAFLFGCKPAIMSIAGEPKVTPTFFDEKNNVACYYVNRGEGIALSCVAVK